MLYLFYGKEKYLINKEIKNIMMKDNIEAINHNSYDLNDTTLEKIIDDANTISLFNTKKLITVDNSYIFTAKKGSIEQNVSLLEKYMEQINPDTILIFITDEEKLDERKKINKLFKQKGQVKEFNKVTNLNNYLKGLFDGYQISDKTIALLIDRVGTNLDILEQEINKIKIYKDGYLEISDSDVINLTHKNIDIDIFTFMENIVNKNKGEALTSYYEMLKHNEEPIKIIVMLANQFRIIYQTKMMSKQGYSDADIAKTLDIHPYRIKLAREKGRGYSETTLLQFLNVFADLDLGIKKGTINKEIGLEMFILKL